MPDEQTMARMIARLEATRDDRMIRRALRGSVVRDAMNGSPLARHVYRLECGHLEEIHGAPLPQRTRRLYCGKPGCGRERNVVEHLT